MSTLAKAEKKPNPVKAPRHGKTLGKRILENWQLYLLLVIPVVITIIYKYIPMYGIQIAFRDYKAGQGFFGSVDAVGVSLRPHDEAFRHAIVFRYPFPRRVSGPQRIILNRCGEPAARLVPLHLAAPAVRCPFRLILPADQVPLLFRRQVPSSQLVSADPYDSRVPV